MKAITLPTNPEVRAALEALGFHQELHRFWEYWRNDTTGESVTIFASGDEPGLHVNASTAHTVLQILGLLPPPEGMVTIPREAAELAETAMWLTKYNMNEAVRYWEKRGNAEAAATCQRNAEKADEACKAIREALSQSQASTPTTPEQGTEDETHVR